MKFKKSITINRTYSMIPLIWNSRNSKTAETESRSLVPRGCDCKVWGLSARGHRETSEWRTFSLDCGSPLPCLGAKNPLPSLEHKLLCLFGCLFLSLNSLLYMRKSLSSSRLSSDVISAVPTSDQSEAPSLVLFSVTPCTKS